MSTNILRLGSIAVALVTAAASGGCSMMSAKDVTVEGLPYSFPKDAMNSLVRPDEGHLYVRLHPPGHEFALLHHPRSDRRQKEVNRLIISTVNESRFSKYRSINTDAGEVICTDIPHYSCGFELYDHDVRWSVIFDASKISDASKMKGEASRLLTSYRRGYADRRGAN